MYNQLVHYIFSVLLILENYNSANHCENALLTKNWNRYILKRLLEHACMHACNYGPHLWSMGVGMGFELDLELEKHMS